MIGKEEPGSRDRFDSVRENKSLPAASVETRENMSQDVKRMTIDQGGGVPAGRWRRGGRVDHAPVGRK